MKTQKGITLIALIITIIVMLILVGVSVSVVLNTGLFKAAQEAAQNTETEKISENELSTGKVTIGNNQYNSLEDYIAGKILIGKIDGLEVGDIVYYDENANGTNDENEKYVVLYNDNTYGCQIMRMKEGKEVTLGASSSASGEEVTLELMEEAKESFNNAVKTLNTEAAEYLNPQYAVYARSLGCSPMYGTMRLETALEKFKTKVDFSELLNNTNIDTSLFKAGGLAEGFLDDIYYYKGEPLEYYGTDVDTWSTLKYDLYEQGGYWLVWNCGSIALPRVIHTGGARILALDAVDKDSSGGFFTSFLDLDPDGSVKVYDPITQPILPILTLKPNLTIASGSGSYETPYVLGF